MTYFYTNWMVSKNHDTDYVVHTTDPSRPKYSFKTREWADLCAKRLKSLDLSLTTTTLNNSNLGNDYIYITDSPHLYVTNKASLTVANRALKNLSKVLLFGYVVVMLPVKRNSIRGFFVNCFFKLVFGAKLEDNNRE